MKEEFKIQMDGWTTPGHEKVRVVFIAEYNDMRQLQEAQDNVEDSIRGYGELLDVQVFQRT